MQRLYRLQQRIAITQIECNVIMCFVLLFALGLTARYVQSHPQPLPDTVYTATMQQFEAASAQTLTDAQDASVAADTVLVAEVVQPTPRPRSQKKALPAARMNLNTASSSQLQRLPRIGPKMAERILTYRNEHGSFKRVSELQNVRGIGEKTLAKLTPYLFVEEEG